MAHLISVDCDAVILVILWKDMVLSKKKVASLHKLFYLINILSTTHTIERKKDFVADSTPIEPNSFGANLIADLVNR